MTLIKKRALVFLFSLFFSGSLLASDFSNLAKGDCSVYLKDDSGKVLISEKIKRNLIPASTLKILTSLCALTELGEEYRFKTEFYIDGKNNLCIKGFGDPLLISEVIESVAEKLSEKINKKKINNIILDGTFFRSKIVIPGVASTSAQPYDAPNGALCSNFNTVFFKKDRKGNFVSGESQTPLLNFVIRRIKLQRFDSGRIRLSPKESLLYTGYLFRHFLKRYGTNVQGDIKHSIINPDESNLIHTYYSDYKLTKIIKMLMEYSNNFIANQIFLTLGAEKLGAPAEISKGLKVLRKFMERRGFKAQVAEGSGISRMNRISSFELMKILTAFRKYKNLLKQNKNDLFKTGTMKDVSSRAGYIEKKGKIYSYIIIVNGKNAYRRLSIIHSKIKKYLNGLIE